MPDFLTHTRGDGDGREPGAFFSRNRKDESQAFEGTQRFLA
jgi:hypothetical protein